MSEGSDGAGPVSGSSDAGAGRSRRMLVVADSDSYLKWGASLAWTLPGPLRPGSGVPGSWRVQVVLLDSPVLPSARQVRVALDGTACSLDALRVVDLDGLDTILDVRQPDVVLLALRGPLVRVVAPRIAARPDRPVLLSGFPGITIPAEPKAIVYREQTDLIVLHSRREVREFARNAAGMPVDVSFGLARLPFLGGSVRGRGSDAAEPARARSADAPRDDVVFAVQAKVPRALEDRERLVGWLVDAARAQPGRRVVVKVRARSGEAQTHAEAHDLQDLLAARSASVGLPTNLVIEDGPMSAHLERAAALVTVSSTAVLEAVAAGVPALLLDDFGVEKAMINTVFVGSGLLAGHEALVAGDYRDPDPAWLEDNYFHPAADDDWIVQLGALVAARDRGVLPQRVRRHNLTGGAVRRAYERRRMLGQHDAGPAAVAGAAATAVALPARWVLRRARRVKAALQPGASAPLGYAPVDTGVEAPVPSRLG
ncbi:DUF6716 putative glycosyltransferase [Agromyces mangrovi Wang et al. 2018]|uniref:DUF6716 putative glycosyltransferase n=1 Tax=Agromyces mangrovi TaxID=1858653 RepID=UPI002572816D|nr:DUF6716 putative glycosyltransferase [Agromyces mangrovi]BDZ63745.1 hypothetical protein GCM10025877_06830 [Agromyces mangrovi]